MKLEDQVTSLELAKRLKELGFEQESCFTWVMDSETREYKLESFPTQFYGKVRNYYCGGKDHSDHPMFSAYTVAELGEMLPEFGETKSEDRYTLYGNEHGFSKFKKEADARAKMLIYLKENNLT